VSSYSEAQTCWEGSGAPRFPWLWIPPPCGEGFGLPRVLRSPCGPWASSMKKSLVCLPVQQDSPVLNARSNVSKAPNVGAIMDLQDVRAGTAVHAYKTCGHEATVPLQCSVSVADHSPGTAAGQCGTTLLIKRGVARRQDRMYPHR
jgi:hypothetical protein